MSHPIVRVQIENSIYDRLVSTSVEYAVISFPYTINRMDLRDPISRITNIAKGKISENYLFISVMLTIFLSKQRNVRRRIFNPTNAILFWGGRNGT